MAAGKYRTIVADPPWDHSDGTGFHYGSKDPRRVGGELEPRSYELAYDHMTVRQISDLPVSELAHGDAHLYLWTTNRFLRAAYDIVEEWGFTPVKPLVWAKEPMGFMGGPFTSSAEFVLYGRRGSLRHTGRPGRQWWQWKRVYDDRGKPLHSAKPEAFLDMVEATSPGPYLEMFARRNRLGWDTWGNEALSHLTCADCGGEIVWTVTRGQHCDSCLRRVATVSLEDHNSWRESAGMPPIEVS